MARLSPNAGGGAAGVTDLGQGVTQDHRCAMRLMHFLLRRHGRAIYGLRAALSARQRAIQPFK